MKAFNFENKQIYDDVKSRLYKGFSIGVEFTVYAIFSPFLQRDIGEIRINYLIKKKRMRNDLIENFKIINGIYNYGKHIFKIKSRTGHF